MLFSEQNFRRRGEFSGSIEVVKKNVTTAYALDELIDIIKDDGNWVEKV